MDVYHPFTFGTLFSGELSADAPIAPAVVIAITAASATANFLTIFLFVFSFWLLLFVFSFCLGCFPFPWSQYTILTWTTTGQNRDDFKPPKDYRLYASTGGSFLRKKSARFSRTDFLSWWRDSNLRPWAVFKATEPNYCSPFFFISIPYSFGFVKQFRIFISWFKSTSFSLWRICVTQQFFHYNFTCPCSIIYFANDCV